MTKRLWAHVTHLFLRSEISSGNSLKGKKAEKAATLKPNTWPVLFKLGISNSSSILLCDDDDVILMMTYLCRTVGCLWPTSWASSSPPCPEPGPAKYFYQLEKHQIFHHRRCHHFLRRRYRDISVAKQIGSLNVRKGEEREKYSILCVLNRWMEEYKTIKRFKKWNWSKSSTAQLIVYK